MVMLKSAIYFNIMILLIMSIIFMIITFTKKENLIFKYIFLIIIPVICWNTIIKMELFNQIIHTKPL